jgi:TonB family protein
MSLARLVRVAILLIALAAFPIQAETVPSSGLQYVRHRVGPKYPWTARVNHLEGAGLFRLDLDSRTGTVTRVSVIESTGHRVLDEAAIGALRKWRFVPGGASAVRIPIRFTITEGSSLGLPEIGANAIYTPVPPYPPGGAPWNIRATGQFQVIVNFETGRVEDVKVLQTIDDAQFDRSVTSTVRKWRFRPRTTHSFKMPFSFR